MKNYIYICLLLLISCDSDLKRQDMKLISRNGVEIFTNVENSKYRVMIKTAMANYDNVWYNFYDYIGEDSIEWFVDQPRIRCDFYPNTNKVKRLDIISYKGKLPDSLDFSELRELEINNCILEGNISMFNYNKIVEMNIYTSFLFDSLLDLSMFQDLKRVTLLDNETEFYLNKELPIKDLLYTDHHRKGYTKKININVNKLTKLDSISVLCVDCSIDFPNKKMKRISIRTSEIDTLCNDKTYTKKAAEPKK